MQRIDPTRSQIINADVLDGLAQLPDGCVHCCVTSPPYWGLRDYGVEGQLGLEATPEEHVANMVGIFREVRRVLRDDGVLFLNLGDSYARSWGAQSRGAGDNGTSTISGNQIKAAPIGTLTGSLKKTPGLKPKDLIGMPWRVAFALQADGWYLRSDIIWAKCNPMPESVTDRPTKAHEFLFLLTKQPRYFYDADAIREKAEYGYEPNGNPFGGQGSAAKNPLMGRRCYTRDSIPHTGRNRRTVWTLTREEWLEHCAELYDLTEDAGDVWQVATQPYSGAHFATFPKKLVEPCILAGTSAEGACAECGAPWVRVVERVGLPRIRGETRNVPPGQMSDGRNKISGRLLREHKARFADVDKGWQPTCDCCFEARSLTVPCTVLDPFMGSGTVAEVARRNGCRYIGIEINADYCKLAAKRLQQGVLEFA